MAKSFRGYFLAAPCRAIFHHSKISS